MTLREEIEQLAKLRGATTAWDPRGWVSVTEPGKLPTIFSPPELMRKALLPADHPEGGKLRPGTGEVFKL